MPTFGFSWEDEKVIISSLPKLKQCQTFALWRFVCDIKAPSYNSQQSGQFNSNSSHLPSSNSNSSSPSSQLTLQIAEELPILLLLGQLLKHNQQSIPARTQRARHAQ